MQDKLVLLVLQHKPNTASNTAAIEYPTATADYGTVVAVGILDAASSGNLLAYANLTTSKVVSSGDVFRFNAVI